MSSVRGFGSSGLRWLGAGLLAAGLLVAYARFPTQPIEDWSDVRSFELDSEECEALRQTRLTTELAALVEAETPPTLGEVAAGFNLELALVCQANDLPDDCGAGPATFEEPLVLPLYRDPARAPRPEAP